jgi:hypothetical protein
MSAVSSMNNGLKSTSLCKTKIRPCVSFLRTVSVFKECNIKRHYDARHKEKYDVFQGQVRTDKSKSFQRALLDNQNVFKTGVDKNSAAVRARFHVAKLIAQEGRPFTDGEFVKRCFISMTEELFPEKRRCVMMSVFMPVH